MVWIVHYLSCIFKNVFVIFLEYVSKLLNDRGWVMAKGRGIHGGELTKVKHNHSRTLQLRNS
jgi:hypothetical protein